MTSFTPQLCDTFIPKWLQIFLAPSTKTILFFGCGGGFDFTQAVMFIPTLLKQGKKIVILSNSFSDVPNLFRDLETVFEETPSNFYKTIVKLCFPVAKDFLNSLTPQKKKAMSYSPELAMLDFFSANLPSSENVFLYANDIHRFGIDNLTDALAFLIQKHSVDVAVTIDGGTDSLMRGDEAAVATIVEDFCSLVALDNVRLNASLNLKSAILLVGGFGADRFHGASDASSLRAVAELTRMGGFLGSSSVQQDSAGFKFFSDFMNFYQNEYPNSMKSIVGSMIISSVVGQYGPYQNDVTPKIVPRSPADTPGSAPLSAVQMLGFRSEASAAAAAPPPGGGSSGGGGGGGGGSSGGGGGGSGSGSGGGGSGARLEKEKEKEEEEEENFVVEKKGKKPGVEVPSATGAARPVWESGVEPDTVGNSRVKKKDGYIWPLMAQVFGFDVGMVLRRNMMTEAFRTRMGTKKDLDRRFYSEMTKVQTEQLDVENVPRQEEMEKS